MLELMCIARKGVAVVAVNSCVRRRRRSSVVRRRPPVNSRPNALFLWNKNGLNKTPTALWTLSNDRSRQALRKSPLNFTRDSQKRWFMVDLFWHQNVGPNVVF